jgi:hypothetical protein
MVSFAMVFLALDFLVIRRCYFCCVVVVFVIFLGLSVIWAADIVLINSGIWRGISAALKVVSVGYLNFVCVFYLVSAGVSFQSGNLLLRTGRNFDSGIFVLNIYFCVSCVFVLILILSRFNNFSFLFQQFRLGCRSVWRDCWTGPGDKDEIGRVSWWSFFLWSFFGPFPWTVYQRAVFVRWRPVSQL